MWVAFTIVISMALMLCLSINYRSFAVMNEEVKENDQLSTKIQSVMDENLQLQEEIHNLKSDARVIKREAQRLGLAPREKVSVPTN
jgi:cell division protein FtsL